ncbi:Os06g0200800, partial [Oryza sativa Japonica Group]
VLSLYYPPLLARSSTPSSPPGGREGRDNSAELAMLAILVSVAFAQILAILSNSFAVGDAAAGYEYDGAADHPVLRMAVSTLTVAVPATFYVGVMELYARVTPVAPPLRRLLAVLAPGMAWITLFLGMPPLVVLLLG